jgi:hypothetical protein
MADIENSLRLVSSGSRFSARARETTCGESGGEGRPLRGSDLGAEAIMDPISKVIGRRDLRRRSK